MSNKKKVAVVLGFIHIVLLTFVIGSQLNQKELNSEEKTIQLEVISDKDNLNEVQEISTNCSTLGELLRETDYCVWNESDYGIYVISLYGAEEDIPNQYWWCLTVNNESSLSGADGVVLEDGSTYTFTLKQGW